MPSRRIHSELTFPARLARERRTDSERARAAALEAREKRESYRRLIGTTTTPMGGR